VPFSFGATSSVAGNAISGSGVLSSHLMASFYATPAIAKMIAVPDNLIETPDWNPAGASNGCARRNPELA
jgi:hypothetical protein